MTEMIKQTDNNGQFRLQTYSVSLTIQKYPKMFRPLSYMTQLESGKVWFSCLKNDLKD